MIKRAKNQQTIYIKITFPGSQLKKALLFLHANGLTSPSHVLKMNILTTTIHPLHPTTCFNKPQDKKCMSVRVQILPSILQSTISTSKVVPPPSLSLSLSLSLSSF